MDSRDNFWEESDVKGYNFDDDESLAAQVCGVSLGGTTRLSQQIKAGLGTIQFDLDSLNAHDETTLLDLHSLVPHKVLDTLLEADNITSSLHQESFTSKEEELAILRRKVQREWSPPDVDSLLCKVLTGQPYSLELYRSLTSKKELLKSAVALGDGNSILMVVLFLSTSLKKSLFYQILSTSPTAVQHYVSYMTTRMQIQEVTDILEMLKNSREASMKYFEFACSQTQRQLQRLKSTSRNHFNDMKEKQVVDNFVKLIEWEESVGKEVGESVSACLEYACSKKWETKGPASPLVLVQEQGVSDRLFQWVALNVKATSGLWPDIHTLFITKGWLGNRRVKTDLPMDVVVIRLHHLNAPTSVLITFLELIDNIDKRLEVAKRVQCHRAVIDVFVSQRDRLALMNYQANIKAQSEDFIFAEQALKNPNVKWKN